MSAIDRAFIRAYEPDVENVEGAGTIAPADSPAEPSAVQAAPSANINWSELTTRCESFYVYAHGPHSSSSASQTGVAPAASSGNEAAPHDNTDSQGDDNQNGQVDRAEQELIEQLAALRATPPPPHATTAAVVRSSSATSKSGPSAGPDYSASSIEQPSLSDVVPADPIGQRRPLSDYIQQDSVDAKFRPALEVDRLAWPPFCRQLIENRDVWGEAIKTIDVAREQGRTLIGIAGADAECGCTTTLICLAAAYSRAGLKVAMVDADYRKPELARRLGVDVETGWDDVLVGRLPLAEAAIFSIEDNALLLPLATGSLSSSEKLESVHASVTAGVLRYHYDLVLFDLGSIGDAGQHAVAKRVVEHCRLDGVVMALNEFDADWSARQQLQQASPGLAEICLGVVQRQSQLA